MSSRPNQGGIWENTRKFNPSDPDFIGVLNVNGEDVKFVGWCSTSEHPQAPKISLKVNTHAMPPVFQTTAKVVDDDIPF